MFLEGSAAYAYRKGGWTEDDIAKLKAMAGKEPGPRIAAELGRTLGATYVEASKLGLSLRINPRSRSSMTADRAAARSGLPASE